MRLKCRLGLHDWDGCQCLWCGATSDQCRDWVRHTEAKTNGGKTRTDQALPISTLSDLQAIADNPSGSYRLTADIDASPTRKWNSGKGFVPIGSKEAPFTGVLEGDGHAIRDLFINRPDETHVGLIGYLATEQARIENLSLKNVNVLGDQYVGGLAGLSNCGHIVQCQVSGRVFGKSYVGGMVGCCMGRIVQCRASAKVSGHDKVGGLTGAGILGAVSECCAYGKVSGKSYDIGGLAGHAYKTDFACSYWDIQATGQRDSAGGEGKTSKEMRSRGAFRCWNFESVWKIGEDPGYPFLRRFIGNGEA